MELKDANFKDHWNDIVFCNQWKMMSGFNMPHKKMSSFVSFPLLGLTLVVKLRNLDFESYWNNLTIFNKIIISDLNMSCQTVSDLV